MWKFWMIDVLTLGVKCSKVWGHLFINYDTIDNLAVDRDSS